MYVCGCLNVLETRFKHPYLIPKRILRSDRPKHIFYYFFNNFLSQLTSGSKDHLLQSVGCVYYILKKIDKINYISYLIFCLTAESIYIYIVSNHQMIHNDIFF